MYASDYGYATDLNICDSFIDYYHEEKCKNNNWLFNSAEQWTLTPYSSSNHKNNSTIWSISTYKSDSGKLSIDQGATANQVFPTLYLKPNIAIASGDGSSSNPYKLELIEE